MIYKEDDLVLCTVKSIEGTTVFVELDQKTQGNIHLSEIAAGRIRNIREFITVGKKIVCKILKVQADRIELSLRRVTAKEREAVLEKHTKERTLRAILLPVLKEKTESVLEKIAKDQDLADFLDKARENATLLEKYVTKTEAQSLAHIFSEKREKDKEIKKIITLKSQGESGLLDIQEILKTDKAQVRYLGSSKFSVIVKDREFKAANVKLTAVITEIEERAKQKHIICEIKE